MSGEQERRPERKPNTPYAMSIREVAKELGLSPAQVHRAEKSAIRKITKALRKYHEESG